MQIKTYNHAIDLLDNENEDPWLREKAIQYLKEHPDRRAIERLVNALEDDSFGVRWKASDALASIGREALIALLCALTDPDRVGDVRLRNGAYRILEHVKVPTVDHLIWKLMLALKGPAADIRTMKEAFELLQVLATQAKRTDQPTHPDYREAVLGHCY